MEVTRPGEQRLAMVIDGHKLQIIAERLSEGEWTLCVENISGIRSVWCDFFDSADAALEAGRKAVETEGIEEFISTDGFDYLV